MMQSPSKDDYKHNHESDGKPCDNRSLGFIIVESNFLLLAMDIEQGLVLGDLIGGQVTFAFHSSY